jgi:hypothetical protein
MKRKAIYDISVDVSKVMAVYLCKHSAERADFSLSVNFAITKYPLL